MFEFVDIKIIDVLDILLVGILIYQVYKLIRGTAAISIFLGILLLYIVWIIVNALNMQLLSSIMGQIIGVGVIAIIVLFQQEIRKFLLRLGNKFNGRGSSFLNKIFGSKDASIKLVELDELTQACRKMSETYTGALIVLA
ncbi:MAG: TIGR00159 family protein, partial [Bacteroidales bacterium]|nr:TIGR00159 family protein [Bacteroidales bacterium]